MLWVSVGTGLVVSFIFAETIGLAAGGLVVPGYFALFLDKPFMIIGTLITSFLAMFLLHLTAKFTILFGRRRLILAVLYGFLIGVLFQVVKGEVPQFDSLAPIGYVIPGLLAYWMDKQGIVDTLAALSIASVVIRLSVILIAQGNPNVLAI